MGSPYFGAYRSVGRYQYLGHQKLNLLMLALAVMAVYFYGRAITKIMMILLFITVEILMEPVGFHSGID